MSTMNIAIIGGVVLLVLMLVQMRRSNAAESPSSSRGRGRGERRRRRGKDAPPAPPEPMPLAAAAGQTAATSMAEPFSAPAAEWPSSDDPAPEMWPPAAEAPPVEWPPVNDPSEPTLMSDPPAEPAFDAPEVDAAESAAAWADDELVTEPGWPMPGEVDVAWSPPAMQESIGMAPTIAPPVVTDSAPAWTEEIAAATTTAAPEHLEWLSAEPAEEEAPVWAPTQAEPEPEPELIWAAEAEADEPAPEPRAWGEPADPAPAWNAVEPAPAWDVQEPVDLDAGYDAQPTGEFPAIQFPEDEPQLAPEFPHGFEEDDFSLPEVELVAIAPAFESPPFPEFSHEPETDLEPVAFWDEPSAQVESTLEPQPVAIAVEEADSASEPPVAWWDDAPEPQPTSDLASGDGVGPSGRFALGGFAMQPGQHALGGVTFRVELAEAPAAWVVCGESDQIPTGTLALVLDGTINCAAEGLEVVMEPGFAPTTQGFTVRAAALAAGPFAVSGSFHLSE